MRAVLHELSRSGGRVRALCGYFFDESGVDKKENLKTLSALGIESSVINKRCSFDGSSVSICIVEINGALQFPNLFKDSACVSGESE